MRWTSPVSATAGVAPVVITAATAPSASVAMAIATAIVEIVRRTISPLLLRRAERRRGARAAARRPARPVPLRSGIDPHLWALEWATVRGHALRRGGRRPGLGHRARHVAVRLTRGGLRRGLCGPDGRRHHAARSRPGHP